MLTTPVSTAFTSKKSRPPTVYLEEISLIRGKKKLFVHLNLSLPPKQWVSLLGPNGVGKSSLLRLIAGLHTSSIQVSGCIFTDNGQPMTKQIAYMPQADLLLPWLTARHNMMLGFKLRSSTHSEYKKQIENMMRLSEQAGLTTALDLYPSQLSGGMRQRVALVRTLMEDKPIILMDEPFSAIDAITRYQLQELAASLLQDKTVLFVTHDPIEALRLADQIYILQGQPAVLKDYASLTPARPRSLHHPELMHLEAPLFAALSQAVEMTSCV
jgi:putative hydroxymethylpyrimidine transport system ATP-binding protein